jgi:hypothetical protein
MENVRFQKAFVSFLSRASVLLAGGFALAALLGFSGVVAQSANPFMDKDAAKGKGTVMDGYNVHQSFDLGGRIASTAGSGPMFDTLVNLQSGPRFLNHTLELHPVNGSKRTLFDGLFEASSGYGGDPYNVTTLRASKGRLYDLRGLFRRDRNYFDYNLLGNPLITGGVNATDASKNFYTYPQVMHAPHRFNTVRRMTDVNLTLLPLAQVSFRAGYAQNINQGPSYSSLHLAGDALLLQNWRDSTDSWLIAVDWKPLERTTLTFEEHLTHYKGNTTWQVTGFNYQLATGTLVNLGFDSIPASSCVSSGLTTPPTTTGTCSGTLQYNRTAPTRTLFPTEEFRFQSSTLRNIQMTGRVLYTGAKMNLPVYSEFFNGLETRNPNSGFTPPKGYAARINTITGHASGKHINVAADFGIVWQLSRVFSLSEQYDFQNFHQSGMGYLSEVDQYGTASMASTPTVTSTTLVTDANNFLGQRTQTNTVMAAWEAVDWAQLSLGYRTRARHIGYVESVPTEDLEDGANYSQKIREHSGLLGMALRPTREWKANVTVETTWADGAFTQISPRQSQHYQIRSTYRPKNWATFTAAFNDLEKRDNVANVNFLAHHRSFAGGASLVPDEHWEVDVNYAYVDVFSRSVNCFVDTVAAAPSGSTPMPMGVACGNAVNSTTSTTAFYGTGYSDAPTHFGSAALVVSPTKHLRSTFGYRVSAVEGKTELLNPAEVPGSLQSRYQTPYANLVWKLTPAWVFKCDYNYYGYGESSATGPTASRNFHGNLYTLGVHYEY